MKLGTLLGAINPKWQKDFVSFVQSGEASAEFLDYLDHDPGAQKAVESAFAAQSEALEGLAQLVKKSVPRTQEEHSHLEQNHDEVSTAVTRAVERITALPGDKRDKAVADVAKSLAHQAAAHPEKVDKLRSTLAALQQEVETLVR
ncbi:MAG TPA: hypothetical protein VFW44_04015 [Bryobacteraceae bacterium]|nr:hypothetical protein [Bryobacteraceae bacterium]